MADDKNGQVDQNDDPSGKIDPSDKAPSYESFQKLLGEKKAAATKAKGFEDELNKLKDMVGEQDRKRLEEKESFKELYEKSQDDLKASADKLEIMQHQQQNARKMRSFLSAAKADIKEQYWGLIDLDKIVMEGDNIDDFSVQKYVESFTAEYGEVMKPKDVRKLPGDSANPDDSSDFSLQTWEKMSAKDKETNLHLLKGKL